MSKKDVPGVNHPLPPGRPKMVSSYGIKQETDGLLPWSWVSERMAVARNYWICTTRPDGNPHVAPVWGIWLDDRLYFGTASNARKAKNLAANPAVVVHLESGDEAVIIEGVAELLANNPITPPMDEAYAAKYQMTLSEAGGDAAIFAVRPQVVLAWAESDFPNTATRWQFD